MIFYALLVLIWEAVSRSGIWPPYLFPSPKEVVKALAWGFGDRSFLIGMGMSIQRIFIGYSISLIFGITLGLLIGRFKILDETVGSLITGLQVLPSICWLPLAILWFGLNEQAIQFVIIMGAFLSIAIATDSGIRNISPIYLRAAKTMGVRGMDLYVRVIFPAALPSIATGMKLGWSFAWRSLMAGELLFVSVGLGQLLQTGRELNDMAQVVAVMFLIAAVGLVFDRLIFAQFEKRLRRQWGTAN
ncbi:MAG: ABC transporter permease [Candidatus Omnitrophica bacterium]|nr:ABC transporter permease [Candidatus Omnitrophota bacterium]